MDTETSVLLVYVAAVDQVSMVDYYTINSYVIFIGFCLFHRQRNCLKSDSYFDSKSVALGRSNINTLRLTHLCRITETWPPTLDEF